MSVEGRTPEEQEMKRRAAERAMDEWYAHVAAREKKDARSDEAEALPPERDDNAWARQAAAANGNAAPTSAPPPASSPSPREKDTGVGGRDMEPATLSDIYDTADPEYDWLIPGLLERLDRVIVTGDEGYGKSTLLRQIAVGAALGENTLGTITDRFDAARAVIVDLENTVPQVRREFDKLFALHGGRGAMGEALDRLRVTCRPGGMALDVNGPDREEVRRWLSDKPDLLVIGPLYKMHEGDPNEEKFGRPLTQFLDGLRQDFDVTLLIEAHAPHNEKRVFGWSGWRRWPEFGFHLSKDGMLEPFRGGRDASRKWPERLTRDGRRWLWTPSAHEPLPDLSSDEYKRHACRQAIRRVLLEAKDREQGPVSKRQLLERANDSTGTTRRGLLAALGAVEAEGLVSEEEGSITRSDGTPYKLTGYVISASWT